MSSIQPAPEFFDMTHGRRAGETGIAALKLLRPCPRESTASGDSFGRRHRRRSMTSEIGPVVRPSLDGSWSRLGRASLAGVELVPHEGPKDRACAAVARLVWPTTVVLGLFILVTS